MTGAKWVCFLHGTTTENRKVRLFHRLESLLQLYADRVVLVSHRQRSRIPWGSETNRVKVIHNAVDPELPVKKSLPIRSATERLHHPPGTKYVVSVGRLSPEKGMDVFVDAIAELCSYDRTVHGLIVGDGPERQSLVRQIACLGLEKRVSLIGYTPTPGDYMSESKTIVLPSRSEGIPNVALEALALRVPVVATSVGGVPEVIIHDESGLLVPSENPRALAEAVRRILADPQFSEKLSCNGYRRVCGEFSVDARYCKVLEVYREIADSASFNVADSFKGVSEERP